MSGCGAASGDAESGFVTLVDADGFHTVLGRTARKKRTLAGVVTVSLRYTSLLLQST